MASGGTQMCRRIQGNELYCKHKYVRYKYIYVSAYVCMCECVVECMCMWIFRQGHAHKNILKGISYFDDFIFLGYFWDVTNN